MFLVIGTAGTSGTNGSVAGFSYDPYGHITGTLFGSVPENLIRYAGGLADPTTGYTHFGQRWYSPLTGAFTTQDTNSYLGNPANGNRYAYAASNPRKLHRPDRANAVASAASHPPSMPTRTQ